MNRFIDIYTYVDHSLCFFVLRAVTLSNIYMWKFCLYLICLKQYSYKLVEYLIIINAFIEYLIVCSLFYYRT